MGSHSEEWSTELSVVCALLWSTIRKEQRVSSLPDTRTTDLQNVACSGCSPRLECEVFFDVSRAFLPSPIKTPVFAVPPEEYRSPIPGGVWEMTKTVYGLEEAPADFDEHFGKVAEDLCDESGSLCLERLTSEPATCHSKLTSVMMCKHMDDGVLVGPDEALDRTSTAMGKILLLKTSCPHLGSEIGRLDQDGTGDFWSSHFQNSSTVCCPVLVWRIEILCILLVCDLNLEFLMRNLCLVQLNTVSTERLWAK